MTKRLLIFALMLLTACLVPAAAFADDQQPEMKTVISWEKYPTCRDVEIPIGDSNLLVIKTTDSKDILVWKSADLGDLSNTVIEQSIPSYVDTGNGTVVHYISGTETYPTEKGFIQVKNGKLSFTGETSSGKNVWSIIGLGKAYQEEKEPLPEDPSLGEDIPEGPMPEDPAPEEVTPEDPAPGEVVPENPTPKEEIPEGSSPEEPGEVTPEDPAVEEPLPENTTTEEAKPEDPTVEEPLPEYPTPEEAVPEDTSPEIPADDMESKDPASGSDSEDNEPGNEVPTQPGDTIIPAEPAVPADTDEPKEDESPREDNIEIEIPENEVPTGSFESDADDDTEIYSEKVPLGKLPQTGQPVGSIAGFILAGFAAIAAGLAAKRKEEK